MMPQAQEWILRTLLSVPGHEARLVTKAAASSADAIMLDLQDGVPSSLKVQARDTVRKALQNVDFGSKRVTVRVNHASTGMLDDDLAAAACPPLEGIVYPMACQVEEIADLARRLDQLEEGLVLERGHFALILLVETPSAVLQAHELATASERVVALLFGAEDYLLEMDAQHDPDQTTLHVPRSLIVMAARAAGIEPLDTPFLEIRDLDGLEAHARRARILGMSGMLVLSPRQVATANQVYSPTEQEVQDARDHLRSSEASRLAGHSYALTNGRLISPSAKKRARRILARFAALDESVRPSLAPQADLHRNHTTGGDR